MSESLSWRNKWALEITDALAGIGSAHQDPLADCIVEANGVIVALEQQVENCVKEKSYMHKRLATLSRYIERQGMLRDFWKWDKEQEALASQETDE